MTTMFVNTELVALAWLSEFMSQGTYATQLPEDNSTWAANGFVVVNAIGGASNIYVPVLSPIVGFDCFAVSKTSNKAPWGKANNLAEKIRNQCYKVKPHRVAAIGNYPAARLFSTYCVSEPIRIRDTTGYARYTMHVALNWAPITL